MKTKPKPPVKLPKAAVLFCQDASLIDTTDPKGALCSINVFGKLGHPVAVVPCRTRQEAREIVRLRGMSGAEQIRFLRNVVFRVPCSFGQSDYQLRVVDAVLRALHLIP